MTNDIRLVASVGNGLELGAIIIESALKRGRGFEAACHQSSTLHASRR
jgi:hypothetical protein